MSKRKYLDLKRGKEGKITRKSFLNTEKKQDSTLMENILENIDAIVSDQMKKDQKEFAITPEKATAKILNDLTNLKIMLSDDTIQEIYAFLIPTNVDVNEIISDRLLRYRFVSKQWKVNFDEYLKVNQDNLVNHIVGFQVPGEEEEFSSPNATTIPTFALPMIKWKQDSFTTVPSSSTKNFPDLDFSDGLDSIESRQFTTTVIDNHRVLLLTQNLGFVFDKRTNEWNALLSHHSESWNVKFLHSICNENDVYSESFYYKGCVYVMGTEDSDGGVVIDLSTLKCTHFDSLRKHRIGSALVMADDGFIYCFGGYNGERTVNRYDVLSHTWTDDDDLPKIPHECCCGHTASMVGRKIYLGGGKVDNNTRIQIYDLESKTWNTISNAFHWILCYGSAVAIGSASIMFFCAQDEPYSTVLFNTQTHTCSIGPKMEETPHTVQSFNDGTIMAISSNGECEIKIGFLRTFIEKKETKENRPNYNFESYSMKELVLAGDSPVLKYLSPELRNDKDIVKAAIQRCGAALKYASDELNNSKDIVLTAVRNYGTAIQYASSELKNDKDIVLAAVQSTMHNSNAMRYASDKLKNDEDIVLTAVKKSGYKALVYASDKFKNNKVKMINFVRTNGIGLQYASSELKNDKEVVLAAVGDVGNALKYASEELRNDRDVVLAAVTQDCTAMEYVSSAALRNERDILLAMVRQNGNLLKHASNDLRNDKDMVLTAVGNVGAAFQYASDELQNDRDIVLAAVGRDGDVLGQLSDEFKNDRDIVLAAVSNYGYALRYAPNVFRKDRGIVLTAVRNDVPPKEDREDNALGYACDELHNDKELVLAAVSRVGDALGYASDQLQNDKDVVLAAVSNDGFALKYASDQLTNDKDVVLAAVNINGMAFNHASDELQDDRDIVLAAVSNEGHALEYVCDEFQSDKEIALAAVSKNSYALKFVSEELTNDREIVLAAISLCGDALYDASYELQEDRDMLIAAKNNGYVRY